MLRLLAKRLLLLAVFFVVAVWVFSVYRQGRPPPPLVAIEGQIDRILVEKDDRRLTLFQGEKVVRQYSIALGLAPEGDKVQEGDGKTPEGVFKIDRRNPASAFHLSLGINYPLPADKARAVANGVGPGGDIFIHGQPNRTAGLVTIGYDWTEGCIAVSDKEIEEIWRLTPIGTEVEIRP